MAIRKEIRNPLVKTWETIEKLREQYEDEMFNFNDGRLKKFEEYYRNMNPFERDILVLYSEYQSYRDVAAETYCSHQMISLIMSIIRDDIKKLNDEK
jgi:hypothetical protein